MGLADDTAWEKEYGHEPKQCKIEKHKRTITGYDHQLVDKLRATKQPYAYKLTMFILDPEIGDVVLNRVMIDFVIELESKYKELQSKLIHHIKVGDIKEI